MQALKCPIILAIISAAGLLLTAISAQKAPAIDFTALGIIYYIAQRCIVQIYLALYRLCDDISKDCQVISLFFAIWYKIKAEQLSDP